MIETSVTSVHPVDVTREDGWWMIHVPDLDLTTQAETWAQVEPMARGVIAADQDLPVSAVAVEVHVHADPGAAQLMFEARLKVAEAERLRAEALAANQAAARRLHADGWSFRLIGRVMGLTHQRAEQLVNGDPARTRTGGTRTKTSPVVTTKSSSGVVRTRRAASGRYVAGVAATTRTDDVRQGRPA